DAGGTDDASAPERSSARQGFLPSSIGLSILVAPETRQLKLRVRWGDYRLHVPREARAAQEEWTRAQLEEPLTVAVPASTKQPRETDVPRSGGLKVALSVRPVACSAAEGGLPADTRSLSVFLVNRRRPAPDETRDEAFAFQA